ncbi:MAG: hypothetical protein LHW56_08680 [Candidatus Cloacimonetes bacterium]|jgi:hypothetical protein|nr:hypothetical protein [Candidatus Cloacimonadota bacterium]MDY0172969.1 hypothetical protein [Candidatus Cloacimonadaceae bacterium]
MRSFDRMPWPVRHKLKGSLVLLVLLAIAFGIWIQRRDHQKIVTGVAISELSFDDWESQYIELGYTVENKTDKEITVRLLAVIWDKENIELASTLFDITVPAHARQTRSKLFDRLTRSLKEGERPHRANITIYPKRSM